jgi:thiol-disulfide isomerase/thioredoxin
VVVVAGVLTAVLLTRHPGASGTAPMISGRTATGTPFRLTSERGHWVLVNFFASWCPPCEAELGPLGSLEQNHPGGLRVVSVPVNDALDAAQRMVATHGGHWAVVDDPSAYVRYRVGGLPESFLIDPGGRIATRYYGSITVDAVTSKLPAPQPSRSS